MISIDVSKALNTDIEKKLIKFKPVDSSSAVAVKIYQSGARLRFTHCHFQANSNVLALCSSSGHLYVINFLTAKCWRLNQLESCTCLRISDLDASELFAAKNNGVIDIMDIDSGAIKGKLLGHQHPVGSISFSQYCTCVSASLVEAIIWDLSSWSKLQVLSLEKSSALKFVLFVPISNHILVCYKDDIIELWRGDNFESLKQFHPSNWRNYSVKSLTISRNGKVMIISGYLPTLAIFQLDLWSLIKFINLPHCINSVKQLEFIPQNFDAGNNKLLAILSGSGVIYFYDIEKNIIMSQLKLTCEISRFSTSCNIAQYICCLLTSGEVEVHCTQFYILKQQESVIDKARMLATVSKLTNHNKTSKKMENVLKSQIDEILEVDKLKSIINEYKEFPQAFRATIWERVLKLPNNKSLYNAIVNHVSVVAFEDLKRDLPLEDKVSMRCLRHLLNNICTWCPFFAQVEYLPYFLFPFVKVLHKKSISCFELCCTIIVNWCQHWFEYYPLPPINVLAMIDNILMEHDFQLLHHIAQRDIKPIIYSWSLLETAFSEVLTAKDWLVLWDHIFVNEPSFLLCAVVAFIILQKKTLLTFTREEEFANFFRSQSYQDVRMLIRKTHYILKNTSDKHHPRQYLQPFTCLECGQYPVFTEYPKEVINFQKEHVTLMENQLRKVDDLKRHVLDEAQRKRQNSEMEIKNEEDRRMIEVEKACLEKVKQYQQKLIRQQDELKRMRQELLDHEHDIIDDARKKLKNREHRNFDVAELLADGLDMSETINQTDLRNLEEMCELEKLGLSRKLDHLNGQHNITKINSDLMNRLVSVKQDSLKLKSEMEKAHAALEPPRKADIALTVASLNSLINKIKSELKQSSLSTDYASTRDHLKVYKLEKETEQLQEETSKLLKSLNKKQNGEYSLCCTEMPCLNQFKCPNKTMQFIQSMMTSYLVNHVRCKNKNYTLDTTNTKTIKPKDTGGGDFDYSPQSEQDTVDYLENLTSPEGYFSKQEETTKSLVQTLENDIAESKEDIRNLCNHIYNAEETFPKHWEACNKLRELCRQQIDILSMEMTKLKRKSDRFDLEMRELEQRIDSWQCIIERAKQVQVQEDLYEH